MPTVWSKYLKAGGTDAVTIERILTAQHVHKVVQSTKRQARLAGQRAERASVFASQVQAEEEVRKKMRRAAATETAAAISSSLASIGRTASPNDDEPVTSQQRQRPRQRQVISWNSRAAAIFAYLHPQLLDLNAGDAASCAGVSRKTFYQWVTTSNNERGFVGKWFDMVLDMTWGQAKRYLPPAVLERFDDVTLADDIKLPPSCLDKFRAARSTAKVVLSTFSGVSPSRRAYEARAFPDEVVSLRKTAKHFVSTAHSGRHKPRRYVEQVAFLRDFVKQAWHSGDPTTVRRIQLALQVEYGPPLPPAFTTLNSNSCLLYTSPSPRDRG